MRIPLRVTAWMCLVWACISTQAGAAAPTAAPARPAAYDVIVSSHSAATAWALALDGAREGDRRPCQVLIGDLEGKMYRCECDQGVHLWEIARGIRDWAKLAGWQVQVEERCLHSDKPAEVTDVEALRQEMRAGRPVAATFSFDKPSGGNLAASVLSQQRFSAVLLNMQGAGGKVKLYLQLPQGWQKLPVAAQVAKLFGLPAPAAPTTATATAPATQVAGPPAMLAAKPATPAAQATAKPLSLPWPPPCPNVVFTFIRGLKRAPAPALPASAPPQTVHTPTPPSG